MSSPAPYLSPSEAASRLGVSPKALRLYEQRGLLAPARTAAGWRAYSPAQMDRAEEIVGLRTLGLSLGQVARVLDGDGESLEPALAAHEATLEGRRRQIASMIAQVRRLRAELAAGQAPVAEDLVRLIEPDDAIRIAFNLPWPWDGEAFELRIVRPLTHIVGPLGSGKTRLARRIAESVPAAVFVGLDRLENDAAAARARIDREPALKARVDRSLAWLIEDGATESGALIALLAALEDEAPALTVVDMLEQDLNRATQEAVIARLRRRGPETRPLFFLTRSSAILDLDAVGADEDILLCPANHSPPVRVAPYPGSPGYEAVATCLATPEVRARTAGVIAMRPQAG